MRKHKVVIADDHGIFRSGLKMVISSIPNVEIVGEAENGRELTTLVQKEEPDVVFCDIKMPIMDGVEATKWISEHYPFVSIIALSMYDDEQIIVDIIEAGAKGYLLKNADRDEIEKAINTVTKDELYYCKYISDKIRDIITQTRLVHKRKQLESEFTEKEKAIIRLICQEYTNKEIGEKLFLSARTVEGYRNKILIKMGVKNTAGIVVEAIKLKLFNPEEFRNNK